MSLETALAEAQVVSLHVPLTDATYHLIDADALERMDSASFLVNTSRGGLIDEGALAAALRAGTIAGAGLDVFEREPLPDDSPLLEAPNLVLTPHAAWYSAQALEELPVIAARQVIDFFAGLPLSEHPQPGPRRSPGDDRRLHEQARRRTMSERVRVSPDEVDLVSPGRRDYWVGLAHDTLWAEWWVPVTVFVGPEARDGEGLVAFGSTHGNEYEGPVAIKHLLGEIELDRVRGRIVLVPVLNPAALRDGTRDGLGVNLNRAFVEDAGETPALASITYRIAKLVREQIWPHVNVVLDLHSGGDVMRFALVSSVHHRATAEETAESPRRRAGSARRS